MPQNKKKTAVVTGGAGFVGSHLSERLYKDGYRVISLDNYFTGSRENHVPGVEYRFGHTKDIEELVPETPDIIYHLGEYSRVEQSVLEPDVVYDLNIVGTKAVVEYWKKKKCKLVYAGSSTKFGDAGKARYTSPYAETKAENSELVRDTGEALALPYAVTYFYNVYGPRERSGVYGTVIEHFKRMYAAGAPCAVVSPGTQERNFTHVDDIVDGLRVVGENGHGDEYGLGNTTAYSIRAVADMFGFGTDIVMFPKRPGNRMTSDLNTTKSKALGWSAKRSLVEYVEAFKNTHARGASREKRVLVFSTTMHPVAGLAEEAFAELARALPQVTFDVVTTRFTEEGVRSPAPNIVVHQVGFGTVFDKFLLPILGPLKAFSLWSGRKYLFTWSLMASYAALAGITFKFFMRAPLLITLADQTLDDLSPIHRFFFSLVLSRADQVYGTHGTQEKAAMHVGGAALPRNTLGEGDAFANALRFAYADIVRIEQGAYEKKPKKILVFSLAYFPKPVGGAEIAIHEITSRIPKEDCEFHVVTLKFFPELPSEEVIGNVHVHRVGIGSGYISKIMFIPQAAWKALSLHKKERFSGMWAMMSYMLLPIVLMRVFGVRIPYALTLQEGDPFERMFERPHVALFRPLLAHGFKHARVIQAISTFLAGWARRLSYTGAVEVIPNGVDVAHFAHRAPEAEVRALQDTLGKKLGDVFLVTTSRLVHKNAVDDLISALTHLPENVFALILGTGPDESKLKSLAQAAGVSSRVKFVGHVEHGELPLYLQASDVFVRASRSEGMGNSFVEAFAAGLPVIATQEGGLSDFIYDEKRNPEKPITAWAVSPDRPDEIARAVEDIMTHREKVAAVTRTAGALAAEKYDWDIVAREMNARIFSRL